MTWQEAEFAARDWMRIHGWPGAELTQAGADGGVDVRAPGEPGAVAQVKLWQGPVGLADVQRLYACGAAEQARPLFFAAGGYTRAAADWADQHGIARFAMPPIVPDNDFARSITVTVNEAAFDPAAARSREPWEEVDAEGMLASHRAFIAKVTELRGGPPWDDKEAKRRIKADKKDARFTGQTGRMADSFRKTRIEEEVKAASRRPQ